MNIVVPVGGRGGHDNLRARLLGSLNRAGYRNTRFVQIVSEQTSEREQHVIAERLLRFAREETYGKPEAKVTPSSDVVTALAESAAASDLLVLGLQQHRGKRLFSEVSLRVARQTQGAWRRDPSATWPTSLQLSATTLVFAPLRQKSRTM